MLLFKLETATKGNMFIGASGTKYIVLFGGNVVVENQLVSFKDYLASRFRLTSLDYWDNSSLQSYLNSRMIGLGLC